MSNTFTFYFLEMSLALTGVDCFITNDLHMLYSKSYLFISLLSNFVCVAIYRNFNFR